MTNAIEATGLVKRYGEVQALDGLSFSVPEGVVFGLLGPNGAGKSTTVKILTTLSRADEGEARVGGYDVIRSAEQVRHLTGVVAQKSGLDPDATGRENVRLQGQIYGLHGRELEQRIDELLYRFGLSDAGDRLVRGYSGGMQRRLDLAAALVHEPEVLFLDEPTTGVDPASRLTVWDELRRINGHGTTVFLTTQYLEEADQLCDRLAIIDGGLIVREGTPSELKAELRQRRGRSVDPTLDEVFLDATGRTRERVAGEVQEVWA